MQDPVRIEESAQRLSELFEIGTLADKIKEVERLEATISADLIHLPYRFIIMDKKQGLLSPAGYHPKERVFIRPAGEVLINSNSLPQSLSGLFFCDQDKKQ